MREEVEERLRPFLCGRRDRPRLRDVVEHHLGDLDGFVAAVRVRLPRQR